MTAAYFEVSLRVVVEVTDAVELMANASLYITEDNASVYIASTTEEALVDRFAVLIEGLYTPAHGMRVWEHSERVNPLADAPPYLDAQRNP